MYLTLLALKLINLNKLHQRKHINIFASLSLTTKIFQKSLIILILLKHCPVIYKRKIVYPPSHVNIIRNNILNYKDVVNSMYVDEKVSLSLNTDLYDCEKLKF